MNFAPLFILLFLVSLTAYAQMQERVAIINTLDDYGFAALPGGLGNSSGGFSSLGNYGNWWSSTEDDGSKSYNHFKSYKHDNAGWATETKSKLFSVRCVMD